jgi:hypothetical protein
VAVLLVLSLWRVCVCVRVGGQEDVGEGGLVAAVVGLHRNTTHQQM